MITVLLLLLAAVALFAHDRIPVDVVAVLLVLALVATGVLTTGEAFAGFSNDVVVALAGLFVLTAGLRNTGVIDEIGRRMHRIAGASPRRLSLLVMLTAAVSAAVMKNTATTAMLLPVVIGLADRAHVDRSKLLIPLAFGAILGGTSTLIGTSTNMAVSSAMTRYGMPPLGMFELASVGLPIVVLGLTYMMLIGIRLLPGRGGQESLLEDYGIREFLSEVIVVPGSPLCGRTIARSRIGQELGLDVVGLVRGKGTRVPPTAETRIEARDSLLVHGRLDDILKVKDKAGIEIKADFKLADAALGEQLFEAMVLRLSEFAGRTLKGLRFRQRYGLNVLAVNRHGVALMSRLSVLPLRFGDVLLVQGRREGVERLAADGHLLVLSDVSSKLQRTGKKRWAVLAFAVFLLMSLPHPWKVPISVAVLLGVMILLASRAVRAHEVYGLIEWRLIVLIACMISFGIAMEKTRADVFLASWIVRLTGQYGPMVVLAGFFLLTVALTQPMSNQAAALVVLPVAVRTAASLGVNPRTFVIAITIAASCSFMTPLEPACVLVYAPGRYRFTDFLKVGTLLTVIVFVVVVVLVPYFWPLH